MAWPPRGFGGVPHVIILPSGRACRPLLCFCPALSGGLAWPPRGLAPSWVLVFPSRALPFLRGLFCRLGSDSRLGFARVFFSGPVGLPRLASLGTQCVPGWSVCGFWSAFRFRVLGFLILQGTPEERDGGSLDGLSPVRFDVRCCPGCRWGFTLPKSTLEDDLCPAGPGLQASGWLGPVRVNVRCCSMQCASGYRSRVARACSTGALPWGSGRSGPGRFDVSVLPSPLGLGFGQPMKELSDASARSCVYADVVLMHLCISTSFNRRGGAWPVFRPGLD